MNPVATRCLVAFHMLVVFLGAGALEAQEGCIQPPGGLISWWTGDGHSRDIAGINTPGFFVGDEWFEAGEVSQAGRFGGDDAWIMADSPDLNFEGSHSFTVAAWVRVDGEAPGSVGATALVDKRGPVSPIGQQGYSLTVGHLSSPPGSYFFDFIIKEDDTNLASVSTAQVTDNAFHFVATVVDRSAQTLAIYLDGALQEITSITHVGSLSNTKRLFLGHHSLDLFTHVAPLVGSLDEVQIFGRALAEGEILAIAEAGSAGQCRSPVLAFGGEARGITVTRVVCRNLTTGERIPFVTNDPVWDCESLGLVVNPGDRVQFRVRGLVN